MPWHWYALYDAISSVNGAKVSMLVIIQALINCVFFDVLSFYWFSKMTLARWYYFYCSKTIMRQNRHRKYERSPQICTDGQFGFIFATPN